MWGCGEFVGKKKRCEKQGQPRKGQKGRPAHGVKTRWTLLLLLGRPSPSPPSSFMAVEMVISFYSVCLSTFESSGPWGAISKRTMIESPAKPSLCDHDMKSIKHAIPLPFLNKSLGVTFSQGHKTKAGKPAWRRRRRSNQQQQQQQPPHEQQQRATAAATAAERSGGKQTGKIIFKKYDF